MIEILKPQDLAERAVHNTKSALAAVDMAFNGLLENPGCGDRHQVLLGKSKSRILDIVEELARALSRREVE